MDERKRIRVRVNDPNLPYRQLGRQVGEPQFPETFESPVLVIYPLVMQSPQSKVVTAEKKITVELKTLLLVVDPTGHLQWVDSMNAEYIEGEFVG